MIKAALVALSSGLLAPLDPIISDGSRLQCCSAAYSSAHESYAVTPYKLFMCLVLQLGEKFEFTKETTRSGLK